MGVENILKRGIENMVENILVVEELGKLAVNDYNKFSVICIESYDYSYKALGVCMEDKNEGGARTFADMMATTVEKSNYYEEGGETLISGTEFYVYDSKGKRIYTGQKIQYMIN